MAAVKIMHIAILTTNILRQKRVGVLFILQET
jgi:hypothetical protein